MTITFEAEKYYHVTILFGIFIRVTNTNHININIFNNVHTTINVLKKYINGKDMLPYYPCPHVMQQMKLVKKINNYTCTKLIIHQIKSLKTHYLAYLIKYEYMTKNIHSSTARTLHRYLRLVHVGKQTPLVDLLVVRHKG